MKKINTNSFEVRNTQKCIYLHFTGQDGVFEVYMNKFKSKRKRNVENGSWNSLPQGSLSEGVIKLNKDLLDDNKQYLLKDFVEKIKYFISQI